MKINENSKKGEPKMNKMEKMQEDIRLLQRQMTNYTCSNIKIGDKVYIKGHKIVPDGYYFITNRDPTVVGVMPYSFKLNYGRGNWVNPQTCDVFKLITPEVTTGKPLTDYMEKHILQPNDQTIIKAIENYPWIAEWCKTGICEDGIIHKGCPCGSSSQCTKKDSICYKLFGTHKGMKNDLTGSCPCNVVGKTVVEETKKRVVILNRKYGFKKHIYEEGDCFRFSDNSSHKLINNGYDEGLLVSLVKDGISWGKLFALNNKIVEDQVEFEKYLKDCRLTYIGIVDKVYFKIRRIS